MTIAGIIHAVRRKAYTTILARRDALKTTAYYERALRRGVRDFFREEMDEFEFIDEMVRLISEQFTRAWNEGMRNVGLDTEDIKPEWQAVLDDRISEEEDHVLDFAQDIVDARQVEGASANDFYPRVDLWVNRYNEIVALAEITCGGDERLEWILGATEQHCVSCSALNGVVATSDDWDASGYHPQGAPNDALECGGWKCDCSLVPTKKPLTKGGIPNV